MPSLLPQLTGRQFVTDGGLETDLIHHHGADLPEFAAFPLVEDERGRQLLVDYFDGYAAIARAAGVGLMLETPTWRANPDWAALVGYDLPALDRVNRASVALMREIRDRHDDLAEVQISGIIGPRGDGYIAGERPDPGEAAAYHAHQIGSFAAAGVDLVNALTITSPEEAVGVVRAARAAGLPVSISFTLETDGTLPDGTSLARAIALVDAEGGPDYFLVNCAHPGHIAPGLVDADGLEADPSWRERIIGLRPNASTKTHAELDAAGELDEGDPAELSSAVDTLRSSLPRLAVLGGCCGTDARHVAALWAQR